jgi:hypothetical protein
MRVLHVSITVRDLNRARPFYEPVMAALGVPKVHDRADAIGFGERNRDFDDAQQPDGCTGRHLTACGTAKPGAASAPGTPAFTTRFGG